MLLEALVRETPVSDWGMAIGAELLFLVAPPWGMAIGEDTNFSSWVMTSLSDWEALLMEALEQSTTGVSLGTQHNGQASHEMMKTLVAN